MTRYLRYEIVNIEPLRISDASNSKNGQTSILRYISGSSIRGLIINKLAANDNFKSIKRDLFSDNIRYLNAYISAKDETEKVIELIPSPKGFYENKTESKDVKKIDNVLSNGKFKEGYKRASLGRYCYIENLNDNDKCIYYTGVDTGSEMKINIQDKENQKVFRSEYIKAGYTFVGYIAFDINEDLGEDNKIKDLAVAIKDVFKDAFKDVIIIGNARSQGLGKCKVVSCDFVENSKIPYEEYLPKNDIIQDISNGNNKEDKKNECYMLLLSNTAMKNSYGEVCGLDLDKLQKLMGVKDLEIEYCSTSVVEVKGYNRTWEMIIPSAMMYEMGSVFKLRFKGDFERKNIYKICNLGIGIKRNEGFGRVLFVDEYEKVQYKQSISDSFKIRNKINVNSKDTLTDDDKEVLTKVAKTYYRNLINEAMINFVMKNEIMNELKMTNNSKKGTIEAFSAKYRYIPDKGVRKIKQYMRHLDDREENQNIQKEKFNIIGLKKFTNYILDDKKSIEDLLEFKTKEKDTVMGICKTELISDNEIKGILLELITMAIQYDNKEGR